MTIQDILDCYTKYYRHADIFVDLITYKYIEAAGDFFTKYKEQIIHTDKFLLLTSIYIDNLLHECIYYIPISNTLVNSILYKNRLEKKQSYLSRIYLMVEKITHCTTIDIDPSIIYMYQWDKTPIIDNFSFIPKPQNLKYKPDPIIKIIQNTNINYPFRNWLLTNLYTHNLTEGHFTEFCLLVKSINNSSKFALFTTLIQLYYPNKFLNVLNIFKN